MFVWRGPIQTAENRRKSRHLRRPLGLAARAADKYRQKSLNCRKEFQPDLRPRVTNRSTNCKMKLHRPRRASTSVFSVYRPPQVTLWVTVGVQPFLHIHTYRRSDPVTYKSSKKISKIDSYPAKVSKILRHTMGRPLFPYIHAPLPAMAHSMTCGSHII